MNDFVESLNHLNWADFVIIGVVALSAIIGLFRGFVREALSLVTWGLAIWIALTYSPLVIDYLKPYLESESLRRIAAFAGLFVATLIVGGIINALVSLLVRKSGISGTDRLLGVLFGVARGLLVVVLLVLLAAGLTPLAKDAWWQASRTMPYFESAAQTLCTYLPKDVEDVCTTVGSATGPAAEGQAPAAADPEAVEPEADGQDQAGGDAADSGPDSASEPPPDGEPEPSTAAQRP